MTQEDKELLLNDLCGRLQNGVIGRCEIDASYDTSFDTIFQTHKFDAVVYGLTEELLFVYPLIEDRDEQNFANEDFSNFVAVLEFKPYLFPLSSMTEEQKREFYKFFEEGITESANETRQWLRTKRADETRRPVTIAYVMVHKLVIEWLNKNHFDYRGLIPMGLAIDATGLNIY